MDYLLESLGDERFQKLCQSILVSVYPNLQCLPVAQPDGGRDAFLRQASSKNGSFIVFQVKFVKDPRAKDAKRILEQVIKSEQAKVKKLIARGRRSAAS